MNARYVIQQPRQGRLVPRCDLKGSPFASKKAAKAAAARAGIDQPRIVTVRRSA